MATLRYVLLCCPNALMADPHSPTKAQILVDVRPHRTPMGLPDYPGRWLPNVYRACSSLDSVCAIYLPCVTHLLSAVHRQKLAASSVVRSATTGGIPTVTTGNPDSVPRRARVIRPHIDISPCCRTQNHAFVLMSGQCFRSTVFI